MDINDLLSRARSLGFNAAVTETRNLTIVPEYRKYCEENRCGCYNRLPACPPASGTVEEMTARFLKFRRALVLQTVVTPADGDLYSKPQQAKVAHNQLAEQLLTRFDTPYLWMSAGPYKQNSCMSAYCVDAQKLANAVGMLCWANDGNYRFFSVICY